MPKKQKSIEELEKELNKLIKDKEKVIAQKKEEARKQDAHIKILIGGFVIKNKNISLLDSLLHSDISQKDKELIQNTIASFQNDQNVTPPAQPLNQGDQL